MINVLAQGHNTVTPVRLEPATPRSRVKHSTTEPLCSLKLQSPEIFHFRSQLIRIYPAAFRAACKSTPKNGILQVNSGVKHVNYGNRVSVSVDSDHAIHFLRWRLYFLKNKQHEQDQSEK